MGNFATGGTQGTQPTARGAKRPPSRRGAKRPPARRGAKRTRNPTRGAKRTPARRGAKRTRPHGRSEANSRTGGPKQTQPQAMGVRGRSPRLGGVGGSAPHSNTEHKTKVSAPREQGSPTLWRCRESNPGPPLLHKGFSVCSPRCLYSDPPVMRTSRCDDPSRCLVSLTAPRPGGQVSSLADAGLRGGNAPGPTDRQLSPRGRKQSGRATFQWHLLFCDTWLTRSSSPSSTRFPLIDSRSRNRSPPCTPGGRASGQDNAFGAGDHPG